MGPWRLTLWLVRGKPGSSPVPWPGTVQCPQPGPPQDTALWTLRGDTRVTSCWELRAVGLWRTEGRPVPSLLCPTGLGHRCQYPPNRTGVPCLPAPGGVPPVFRGCREGLGEEQGAGSDVALTGGHSGRRGRGRGDGDGHRVAERLPPRPSLT